MLGTLALSMCQVRSTDVRGMDCEDGKFLILGQTVLSGTARKRKISSIRDPGSGIQMDKDHLPLLEDQNPLRRSEIFAGTRRAKFALAEAIKSLSNASGREGDVKGLKKHS